MVDLKCAFGQEIKAFREAQREGRVADAWTALERGHIIAQHGLGMHLASHMHMLRFALAQRDAGETLGQLARLLLAPLGSLTGRIPWGNTGRANVNAFKPMDIPADLRALLQPEKQ